MDLTLLTTCYNTPTLIPNLLRSLVDTCSVSIPKVLVINSSTDDKISDELSEYDIPHHNIPNTIH